LFVLQSLEQRFKIALAEAACTLRWMTFKENVGRVDGFWEKICSR